MSRQRGCICQPEYQGGEQDDGENAQAGQKADLFLRRREAPFFDATFDSCLRLGCTNAWFVPQNQKVPVIFPVTSCRLNPFDGRVRLLYAEG
jgi:hypothetical protein